MDWNKQYNASNNALLRQNTQQASLVSQNDMAFSTHFDKDGKATFINDGDYKAYKTNEDGTIAYKYDEKGNIIYNEDGTPQYEENNEYTYKEGFGLTIAKGKEKAFKDQIMTNEVRADLFRLHLMGGGGKCWLKI